MLRHAIGFGSLVAAAILISLAAAPASATPADDARVCTTDPSPADAAIPACDRLIASRKVSGVTLATLHFWRGVAYNKRGDYTKVIEDMTESLRITPGTVAALNLRGSAYYDKGEYDIAIADFNDAIKIGPPHPTFFHNRGNAWRGKKDFARAIADYSESLRLDPKGGAFSYQNRGASKQAMGDLDGALADINEAIRLNPKLPSVFINRGTLWRAKGEFDRAIADEDEAIRLANSGIPVPAMTPPGSWLVNAHVHRGLAFEAKGEVGKAREDFVAALAVKAADAGSKSNQATATARLAVLAGGGKSEAPPAVTATGRRVALVIGNGNYQGVQKLPNPVNDAHAVAAGLRGMGFDVSEGTDLDRAAMETLMRTFMRDAVTAHIAVVFYAGHGMQIDGRNFLLPIDIRTDNVTELSSAMTDVDTILAGLDDQIRTNVVILDACRDNPLAQKTQSPAGASRSVTTRSGLAAPAAPAAGQTLGAGTLIAFATAPGQVALDGEGSNSPFSAALARHIATPGLELQSMLTRVRAEVVAATKNRQVPWSNSSLLGEVYLAGKP